MKRTALLKDLTR